MPDMRQFGPTPKDHPLVQEKTKCPACCKRFAEGDFTTLVEIGPGDDPEEQALARLGRVYSAVSMPVHWSCATGLPNKAQT